MPAVHLGALSMPSLSPPWMPELVPAATGAGHSASCVSMAVRNGSAKSRIEYKSPEPGRHSHHHPAAVLRAPPIHTSSPQLKVSPINSIAPRLLSGWQDHGT